VRAVGICSVCVCVRVCLGPALHCIALHCPPSATATTQATGNNCSNCNCRVPTTALYSRQRLWDKHTHTHTHEHTCAWGVGQQAVGGWVLQRNCHCHSTGRHFCGGSKCWGQSTNIRTKK